MTYSAIVEGMEKKERGQFDRDLYAGEPARRAGDHRVIATPQSENVGGLMAAFGLPVAD